MRNEGGGFAANSELFKEGYDEAMYKNSCKI